MVKKKEHRCTDGVACHHTVADLNPRSQVVKSTEMTVIRCLALIKLWDDEIGKTSYKDKAKYSYVKKDWTDVQPAKYFKILGERAYSVEAILIEMFKRYKAGTLQREVLDLYETLPPKVQARKEIKNGIAAIRKKFDR